MHDSLTATQRHHPPPVDFHCSAWCYNKCLVVLYTDRKRTETEKIITVTETVTEQVRLYYGSGTGAPNWDALGPQSRPI